MMLLRLANVGPVSVDFDIQYGTTEEMSEFESSAGSKEDVYAGFLAQARTRVAVRSTNNNPFIIEPCTGSVPPFSKVEVLVTFAPRASDPAKGFKTTLPGAQDATRTFDYLMFVSATGQGRVKVPLTGQGTPARLAVNPTLLHFGNVPCNDWADQLVTLTNNSVGVTAHYEAPKLHPYLELSPPAGSILPGQTIKLNARYWPRALGQHATALPICIVGTAVKAPPSIAAVIAGEDASGAPAKKAELASGRPVLSELLVELVGESLVMGVKPPALGGPDKVPADFVRPAHFVDEEEVLLGTLARQMGKSYVRPALWEEPTTARLLGEVERGSKLGLTTQEAQAKAAHQSRYNEFVRAARARAADRTRVGRKALDYERDVNLGMNTRSGISLTVQDIKGVEKHRSLVQTTLGVRNKHVVDELWTPASAQNPQPRQRKAVPADEMDAAIVFEQDMPLTPEEVEVCGTALDYTHVCALIVGPKVVDFGKVRMNSVVTSYWLITNVLKKPIHVVLDMARHMDLNASKHTAQVVPPGKTAKFPLTLTATGEVRACVCCA